MSGRLHKQVSPKAAALLILALLIGVQWAWWRGLIYREPSRSPGPGGPGPSQGSNVTTLQGREDVAVDTLAGDADPGDADGPGHAARFDRPTGLAVDPLGNLYVADTGNHRIRRVSSRGEVTTVAGGEAGYRDGRVSEARFSAPCGVAAAPDGSLYVADTGNGRVRRIRGGRVTTLEAYPSAAPSLPCAIAYVPAAEPRLLVADAGRRSVLKVRLDGTVVGMRKMPGVPTAVTAGGGVAVPEAGVLLLGGRLRRPPRVTGSPAAPDDAREDPFALRRPVAVWPVPDGWIVADEGHAAVFRVDSEQSGAEVLAGRVTSTGAPQGTEDGDGAHASFGGVSSVVVDGRGRIYAADTANNMVRRLTLPEGDAR